MYVQIGRHVCICICMYVGPMNIRKYVRCFDEKIDKLTKLEAGDACNDFLEDGLIKELLIN